MGKLDDGQINLGLLGGGHFTGNAEGLINNRMAQETILKGMPINAIKGFPATPVTTPSAASIPAPPTYQPAPNPFTLGSPQQVALQAQVNEGANRAFDGAQRKGLVGNLATLSDGIEAQRRQHLTDLNNGMIASNFDAAIDFDQGERRRAEQSRQFGTLFDLGGREIDHKIKQRNNSKTQAMAQTFMQVLPYLASALSSQGGK